MPDLSPETEAAVRAAAEATGHLSDYPYKPCPRGCTVPADLHRHYEREPGTYFALAAPMPCCGREYARADELLILDQCAWCRADGKPFPGVLIYPAYRPRRRG